MGFDNPPEERIRALLDESRTIAVVGCSPRPERTSHQIAAAMQARGYRILPIHPSGGRILGEKVFSSLLEIPRDTRVDIVDVFRRSEFTPDVARQAVRIGARALWLQQGVFHEEAAEIATAGGLVCVMDACIAVWHRMLVG